ncbi:MAG TPA: hypothetical protein VE569_03240 [Acidimicrobiia bacterium]|nr:hypothetical protein [Acidimicrobiia bacterium]
MEGLTPGRHVLVVDGSTVSDAGKVYPLFEIGVDVGVGGTTVLEQPVWMPMVDRDTSVEVPEVARRDYVVTSPDIPGLEMRCF